MSLILEALRKSEAERRRGSTPDVAMELPPASVARARATPAWLPLAIVLGAIAVLAGGWWLQRDADVVRNDAPIATSPIAEPRIETPAQPVIVERPAQAPAQPPAAAPTTDAPPAPIATAVEPVPAPARGLPTPPPAPVPSDRSDVADIDDTSIPAIKLSMHMWDEAPGKRFVILDGQRMAEGDRNGEIGVVAIERDGVVIERNGQRARVPLP